MSNSGRYLRQLDIYNPDEHANDRVMFVGVGGIGSFAAFGAAKLGVPNITLIDPDTVEEHNVPNQFYEQHDLDLPKVVCMQTHVGLAQPECLATIHEAKGQDVAMSGVVVSGLDSMEAREAVWRGVKLRPQVPLYIDARIGHQIIVIYAVNPTDYMDGMSYEKTLHSDADAEEEGCTDRGIIDVGLMVGSLITRMLRYHFTGQPLDKITVMNQQTLTVTKGGWVE